MTLKQRGFTLIEFIMMLTVLGILSSMAAPAFTSTAERWRLKQQTYLLHTMLGHAREQAIIANQRVTLCPLNAQNICYNDWNQPLTLFEDPNNDQKLGSNEKVLRIFPAQNNYQATRNFNNYAISFNSQGQAGYATGSLSFCLKGTQTLGAVFVIARTGRIRAENSLSTGVLPTLANGSPLPCLS